MMASKKRKIIIERYQISWLQQFEAEKKRIQKKLRHVRILHIGSTSITGLGAKPVIDMMGVVSSLKKISGYVEKLAQLGYIYYPELEIQTPDRKFFQRRIDDVPCYHLSFTTSVTDYYERHLLFRDYLRKHPESVSAYEELKRKLAKLYVDDFDAYNEGKTKLITTIVNKARKEVLRKINTEADFAV